MIVQLHAQLTLEEANTLQEAIDFYRTVQRWNVGTQHSTEREREMAQRRIHNLDDIELKAKMEMTPS